MDPSEWKYLEEGGAHIVFAYTGASKELIGKVIRVPKDSAQDAQVQRSKDGLQILFYQTTLKIFDLGSYATHMDRLAVDPDLLQRLFQECSSLRPLHRQLKPEHFFVGYVQLMSNLFDDQNYGYSVEIKPKWGWVCSEGEVPSRKCKFCRLQGTRVYTVGDYCPVRIFSSERMLVRKAIEALFETPRNQLRIYRDGRICRSPSVLLADTLVEILCEDPILRRIEKAQRDMFSKYKDAQLNENTSPAQYLAALETQLRNGIFFDPLVYFLTAIALEDISLIISFNLDCNSSIKKPWKISIIDLDIKLPTKLSHYMAEHDWFWS